MNARIILPILLILCLLSACAPTAPPLTPPPTLTLTPSATVKPIATLTPWSTRTPGPTATTVPQCWSEGGRIVEDQFTSDLLGETLPLTIYLPPCYDHYPERDFPTLYLIHGQGFDQRQWADIGITNLEDQSVRAGTAPPVLMVMPYVPDWEGPSEFPFGQAVVEELIPYIEAHYQARSGREWRAVGGISRGGSWALHLGLKYWEHFAAFGAHSLPVFYDDAPSVPYWLDAIPTDQLPAIYVDYAESDQSAIRRSADTFMGQLDERGIPYTFSTAPGTHTQAYWRSQAEAYFHFYLSGWEE